MTIKEKVLEEIDQMPPEYYDILLGFINSLKENTQKSMIETTILSEPVLAKDWLKPEEDEAWSDL